MFFSDAVVAIALTLLVLPLAEAVPEAVGQHVTSLEVITENQWQIYSFLLSFIVIARLWISHHHVFAQVTSYNTSLVVANLGWLLTIVVLPFPTEMVGAFGGDGFTTLFYIGTILAGSICQLVIILIIRGNPELRVSSRELPDRQRFGSMVNTVIMLLALTLTALVPRVGYFSILLLLLTPAVFRLRYRRPATGGPRV
ncbi:Uncharacterized membrane protein [Streptosporangium subroseum]|uniref:Uncharacterized membrane protein n=1 Tax=Streptosporangium subroseum TaxID=106412 RepID=A0A239D9S9_9ACTN|nr:Uncharacterized membrane protein [Streptosporangium subroseum]